MTTIGKVMYWKGDRLIELQQELLNRTLRAKRTIELLLLMNNTTTMKTKKEYRVCAVMSIPCYLIVEACDEEEAREIARDTDGGDFISDDNPFAGDWEIQHDVECLTDQQ